MSATVALYRGPVTEFLEERRAKNRMIATHVSLTGGSYHIDEANQVRFYDMVSQALRNEGGVIPCVVERHTTVFGMYIDFDGKFRLPTLSEGAIARMAEVMTRQMRRFYAEMDESRWASTGSRMIVLTKTGGVEQTACGLYKHGLHIHFPSLLVNVDQARQIRLGIVTGLHAVQNWEAEFGEERPDWDAIIDHCVYALGLRMIGAPKARKCDLCKGDPIRSGCSGCGSRSCGYILTDSVYILSRDSHGAVFVNGNESLEYRSFLLDNLARLVRATSVRSDTTTVTPGYAVYQGCPLYVNESRRNGNGKRPLRIGDRDVERLDAKWRRGDEVMDPKKIAIIKKYLEKHSEKYRSCYISKIMQATNDGSIRVALGGDNATYCLNKLDHHKSNRVYMVMEKNKSNNDYGSAMKCFCKCAVARPRTGKTCERYTSDYHYLDKEERDVMFPSADKKKKKVEAPYRIVDNANEIPLEDLAVGLRELFDDPGPTNGNLSTS